MRTPKTGFRRRLNVEQLERRCVPAGNVTAFVDEGDLEIIGDGLGNWVIAFSDFSEGRLDRVVIFGFDWEGAPTTVNGQEFVVLSGVVNDVTFELGGGNDFAFAYYLYVPSELDIDTGAGDDAVVAEGVYVAGLGAADDEGKIETGAGDDTVYIVDSYYDVLLEVDLDSGNDILWIENTTVVDFFEAHGRDGFDQFYDLGGNAFLGGTQLTGFEVIG